MSAPPRGSAARLGGELPPEDWEGDEVLVYGTFGDANGGIPEPGTYAMPLVSVHRFALSRAAMRDNSWENNLPLPGDRPFLIDPAVAELLPAADEPLPQPQPKRSAAGPVLAAACDRALVISGGRPLAHAPTEGVRVAQAPPVASNGLDYRTLLDIEGAVANPAIGHRPAPSGCFPHSH